MKKVNFLLYILISLFAFFGLKTTKATATKSIQPKLAVVIVIDQFANHYIDKLRNNFKYAFKDLLENGVVYTNAYHPHGSPSTATGHLALNTGTLAYKHGISSNKWIDSQNKKIKYETDESANAKTFFDSANSGISPKNITIDGLTESFLANNKNNKVFALSYKTRAAVACASKQGKAIWFDKNSGNFTSSKYYFDELPAWVRKFNQEKNPAQLQKYSWETMYPNQSSAYQFENIHNYDFARYPSSLVGTKIEIDLSGKKPFEFFKKIPAANQHLIDLAKECLNQNLNKDTNQFLLWLSLSSLDPVGHCYGPNSLEVTDLIYHLDKQIQEFMNFVKQKVGSENVLFVLTADHGICQIPELLQKINPNAKRILATDLVNKMNNLIKDKYQIENIVMFPSGISFFLDKEKLNSKGKEAKKQILADLTDLLKKQSGIQNAWLTKELKKQTFKFDQIENFYKMQIYPKRTGPIIFQPEKYCFVTKKTKGSVHKTCHEYDTHVPLILYQKNKIENKVINEKVWMPQLASTIAKIIGVPKPSTSEFGPLPGI